MSSNTPSPNTPSPNTLPTFVFVHGTACKAAVWAPLQRELALLGHRSLALDLPGVDASHPAGYYQCPQDLEAWAREPSACAGVTPEDNVRHVVDNLRRVAEHGPVVLIGTSGGGVTISAVGNAAPELIDRIVYVSAWCLASTPNVTEGNNWPEQRVSEFHRIPFPLVGDPEELGVVRTNLRLADQELFARMKEAMLADGTDDDFRALVDTFEPDVNPSFGTVDCRIDPETWGSIPHSYIRLASDRSIPIAAQDRMIAEVDAAVPDNPFDVHTIDSSHVGFFVRPREFAVLLDRVARH